MVHQAYGCTFTRNIQTHSFKPRTQIPNHSMTYMKKTYTLSFNYKNDTTDKLKYASYLELHLEIEYKSRWRTKLCDQRDEFSFHTVNLA